MLVTKNSYQVVILTDAKWREPYHHQMIHQMINRIGGDNNHVELVNSIFNLLLKTNIQNLNFASDNTKRRNTF